MLGEPPLPPYSFLENASVNSTYTVYIRISIVLLVTTALNLVLLFSDKSIKQRYSTMAFLLFLLISREGDVVLISEHRDLSAYTRDVLVFYRFCTVYICTYAIQVYGNRRLIRVPNS